MRTTLPASITVHGAMLAALVLVAAPPPQPPAIVRVSLAMPAPKAEPAPAPAPVMQPTPPPVAQAKPPPPRPAPPKPQVKPLARQAPVQAPPPAPIPQTPSPVAAEPAPVTASAAPVAEAAAAAPANAAPSFGEPGKAKADYMAQLRAWLEKHKDYPRAARQRGLEGVAHLRFVMDRDGRVLSHQITRGSGYDLLDEEVEEMIRRAQPLPPMPPEMHQAQLEVVVPIGFRLR